MTGPHIPELTPPKASNFLRAEKDVTLSLIRYEARFPCFYQPKPHSVCEVRSGSLRTGVKGAIVLSYLLSGGHGHGSPGYFLPNWHMDFNFQV